MPQPLDDTVRRRMRRQRRRDSEAELAIRRRLHSLGHRFRVDHRPEPSIRSRGDIVFTRRKVIVFVDGCFWHGCPEHATQPKNNADWWRAKLDANRARDRRATLAFEDLGWTVIRVWEHEDPDAVVQMIRAHL